MFFSLQVREGRMVSREKRVQLENLDRRLAAVIMTTCVALLGLIVLMISASVFSRFVIFSPLNFADPLSKYLMQWMAFLGVGLAIRSGEHVLVDMLRLALTLKWCRLLLILLNLLMSLLFMVLVYNGLLNAWSARNSSDPFVFGVSMMIPYLSVPVGALYALVQTNLTTWLTLADPAYREQGRTHMGTGI